MPWVIEKIKQLKTRRLMMINKPMSSSDQGKILIFTIILLPSILFFVGIIPSIFLSFGLYMMKRNKDFSYIDVSVRYFKRYVWIVLILFVFMFIFVLVKEPSYHNIELSFLYCSIAIIYLVSVNILFYGPLSRHSQWVENNGVFSGKLNLKNQEDDEPSTIKFEKSSKYTIADELMKYSLLKENGHITDEEFDKAKENLLK
jgi:hypothetical protein